MTEAQLKLSETPEENVTSCRKYMEGRTSGLPEPEFETTSEFGFLPLHVGFLVSD